MPSIVTHYFFAKDASKNLKQNIDMDTYLLFAQSFDLLFYYQFLTPWKGKEIRNLGHTAQNKNTNLYFENILKYIKEKRLEKNPQVLGYLYGSLTHYILDKTCHPFIFYYTGDFKKNKKYWGLHEKMEVTIDAYIYETKTSQSLKKARLANKLLPKVRFSPELKNSIDFTYEQTFNQKKASIILEKAIKTGNFLLKYGVTDRTGLKTALYSLYDNLFKYKGFKLTNLSFHITNIDLKYLNLNHEKWYYAANKKISSNSSFNDLYSTALEEIKFIFNEINRYLTNQISLKKLLNIIKDTSYVTGLPLKEKKENTYFKF